MNHFVSFTVKFLSEALIFASNNPQYDNRLFIPIRDEYSNFAGAMWHAFYKITTLTIQKAYCMQALITRHLYFKPNFWNQKMNIYEPVYPSFISRRNTLFLALRKYFLVQSPSWHVFFLCWKQIDNISGKYGSCSSLPTPPL